MDLVDLYFTELSIKRAQFQAGPQKPKPLTPWQRISASFGRGAAWGGAQGAVVGAMIPQAKAMTGLSSSDNLVGNTAVSAGVGGAVGGVFGGLNQVFEDEMRRRVAIESRRKIIEAQKLEQLAGGDSAPAMELAAMGIPKHLIVPEMGVGRALRSA